MDIAALLSPLGASPPSVGDGGNAVGETMDGNPQESPFAAVFNTAMAGVEIPPETLMAVVEVPIVDALPTTEMVLPPATTADLPLDPTATAAPAVDAVPVLTNPLAPTAAVTPLESAPDAALEAETPVDVSMDAADDFPQSPDIATPTPTQGLRSDESLTDRTELDAEEAPPPDPDKPKSNRASRKEAATRASNTPSPKLDQAENLNPTPVTNVTPEVVAAANASVPANAPQEVPSTPLPTAASVAPTDLTVTARVPETVVLKSVPTGQRSKAPRVESGVEIPTLAVGPQTAESPVIEGTAELGADSKTETPVFAPILLTDEVSAPPTTTEPLVAESPNFTSAPQVVAAPVVIENPKSSTANADVNDASKIVEPASLAVAVPETLEVAESRPESEPSAETATGETVGIESALAGHADLSQGESSPRDSDQPHDAQPEMMVGETKVSTTNVATDRPEAGTNRPEVDRHLVVKQVAERIENLVAARPRDGVTVHLEPRDLGTVTLVVKGAAEALEVQMFASDERVRQSLQESRPELAQSLAPRGIEIRELKISDQPTSTNNGNGGSMSGSGQSQQGTPDGRPRPQTTAYQNNSSSPTARTTEAPARRSARSGGVDLLI